MLAIQPALKSSTPKPPPTTTPNLLPCTIRHSGPMRMSRRHWNPQTTRPTQTPSQHSEQQPRQQDQEAPPTAYFRGRKLLGRRVPLPEGYTGVVLQKTERVLPRVNKEAGLGVEGAREEEEDESDEVEVKVMEQTGRFEEFVVWGHEAAPDDEDVYIRGMREWIGFAESMHAYDEDDKIS